MLNNRRFVMHTTCAAIRRLIRYLYLDYNYGVSRVIRCWLRSLTQAPSFHTGGEVLQKNILFRQEFPAFLNDLWVDYHASRSLSQSSDLITVPMF